VLVQSSRTESRLVGGRMPTRHTEICERERRYLDPQPKVERVTLSGARGNSYVTRRSANLLGAFCFRLLLACCRISYRAIRVGPLPRGRRSRA
jgi:hypothetical protein